MFKSPGAVAGPSKELSSGFGFFRKIIQMENTIANDPRAGFLIIILLSLGDLLLRKKIRNGHARAEFFEYEASISQDTGFIANFAIILLKISPAFLVALVWALGQASKSAVVVTLYAALVGFSISLYFIVNLRHIESLMIDALVRRRRNDISGKLIIKRKFSLGQSAIQIFTIFVILAMAAAIRPSPLFIGIALAPASLIARNMLLAR